MMVVIETPHGRIVCETPDFAEKPGPSDRVYTMADAAEIFARLDRLEAEFPEKPEPKR